MDFSTIIGIIVIIGIVLVINRPIGIALIALGGVSIFFPTIALGIVGLCVIGGIIYLMGAAGGEDI